MNLLSTEHIINRFSNQRNKHRLLRRYSAKAAVAIILQNRQGKVHVLMQKRVERKGDPWSGDMAFPGGKASPTDKDSWDTACRETMEEIGVALNEATYLGQLTDMLVLKHQLNGLMVVTPHVCILQTKITPILNDEVEDVVWIPLDLFMNKTNRGSFKQPLGRLKIPFACYDFNQYRIWGLSLAMLKNLQKVIT